eukprot:TRINITY_DN24755_c0_g1_i1.p1 TRINITY_DN24755_c0_g1~~TRINITY_DN24755_c0_g1_i1.p1  ORF type:complete len:101 (-),score=38.48 TRINITY_DN24755_c0_g1_i1:127-429(-)
MCIRDRSTGGSHSHTDVTGADASPVLTSPVLCFAQPASERPTEILPKAGLVYSEKGNLSEVLCKPKIMPMKSVTLQKLEEMEKFAANLAATAAEEEEEQI